MPVTSYLYMGGFLFSNTIFYQQVSNEDIFIRIIICFQHFTFILWPRINLVNLSQIMLFHMQFSFVQIFIRTVLCFKKYHESDLLIRPHPSDFQLISVPQRIKYNHVDIILFDITHNKQNLMILYSFFAFYFFGWATVLQQ